MNFNQQLAINLILVNKSYFSGPRKLSIFYFFHFFNIFFRNQEYNTTNILLFSTSQILGIFYVSDNYVINVLFLQFCTREI